VRGVVRSQQEEKKDNDCWLERREKDVWRYSPDRSRCWNGACRSPRRRCHLPVQTK